MGLQKKCARFFGSQGWVRRNAKLPRISWITNIRMDRHFLNFTGIDFEALKAELAKGGGDSELLSWVNANAKYPRQPWEIAAWSDYHEHRTPESDAETLTDFADALGKFTTTREDIRTWFDLLDLDDHCTFGGKP